MPMLRLAETMTLGGAALLSNPFFVKLGLIGLFLNSLLSSVIPIPTELTTSGLLLAGQSKIIVFTILVIGSYRRLYRILYRLWRYQIFKSFKEKTK